MNPRKTQVIVTFKTKKFSKKIDAYLENFSYTDCANGESDSIDIKVSNTKKVWNTKWKPEKGDILTAKIQQRNWRNLSGNKRETLVTVKCGTFYIDDLTYTGRPLVCNMGAIASPVYSKFNTETLTKTWENVSVKQIAKVIAEAAGLNLHYDASDISIASIEQSGQTNCNFLNSICKDYGLAMKIYSNKIVILDEEKLEQKKPVATIKETGIIKWTHNSTMEGTYTGAKFSYTNPDNDKTLEVTVGGGSRIKNINVSANNLMEAQLKGIALLNNENKKAETMSITIPADNKIYAGTNVTIKGFGNLNGKYFVDKVKHSIGTNYTMTLTLRKVQERIKSVAMAAVANATATAETTGSAKQHTVVSGDTLWALAVKYYGAGVQYTKIYNANSTVIEEAAKAHGKSSSENGHWIYPGTVLNIPA